MENKFTHKEFIERHVEFIKNYSTKYRFQDLDFKSVMFMNGCKDDEFREHMDKMWRKKEQNIKSLTEEDWGDEDDDGDDSNSSMNEAYGRDYGDEDDGGDN